MTFHFSRVARAASALLRAAVLALLSTGGGEAARAQVAAPSEYDVKAAFLYNFARFGEWPAKAFADATRLRLCIIGGDPFGAAINAVAGKPVGERQVEVVRLDAADDARSCQIAFIAGSNPMAVARRLERLPVLTVAENPDFARSGGAIEFNLVDNRVRFAINPAAAQRAGVTLSSQLLRLATIVEERR